MANKLFKSFKKPLKPRTKEEIDKDYTHHAVHIGHKARVIAQLQAEVDEHVQQLIEINKEGMALAPSTVAETSQPQEQKTDAS